MLGTTSEPSFRFQHSTAFDWGKITNLAMVTSQQVDSNLEVLCSLLADLSKSSVTLFVSVKQQSAFC